MKELLLLFIITFTFISCDKKYTYTEFGEEHSLLTGDNLIEKISIIKAQNDSLAYLEAFKEFYIHKKVEKIMIEKLGRSNYTPKKFILTNNKSYVVDESIFSVNIDSIKLNIKNSIDELNI